MILDFHTRAVHAGTAPDPTTGARATPIYQSSSFVFQSVEHAARLFGLHEFGNIYSRLTNPTCAALEGRIADLEGGTAAVAVASGHAAEFLVFHTLLRPGDSFVAAKQLYGGSINQFQHSYQNFGWHVDWADGFDVESFERAIGDRTKAIFIESIANPSGAVLDIEAIARVAERHKIPLIVDNTMATPYLIRPFEHGANLIVHSATKFLGGHGNAIGGLIVDGGRFPWQGDTRYPMLSAPRPEYNGMVLGDTFGTIAFAIAARVLGLRDLGPCLAPFNAFLLLTGIETLPLRMKKHCENALKIAEFLEAHPKIADVNYVGLPSNVGYALAKRYTPNGAGAVFTFRVKGGFDAGVRLVESVKLFSHLANIGDTRSLIIHPASTTHRQLSEEQRVQAGAGSDVVRISVGIEDVRDLIHDLKWALA
jgi:O-acetylhomoserine (thiol)-lyase